MDPRDTGAHLAAIRNDCWMVRHYGPARTPAMRLRRQQAIQRLGLTVRAAFDSSDDFEALFATLLDGLRPTNDPPF